MEKQFLCTGKIQARVARMTFTGLTRYNRLAGNPTARRNLIPSVKKHHSESATHDILRLLTLIGDPDRFPPGKNSSNGGDNRPRHQNDRLRPSRGKAQRNGSPLTTHHLFWPNERRRAALLLPIWRRNPRFSRRQVRPKGQRGGGGVDARIRRKCSDRKPRTENFHQWREGRIWKGLAQKKSATNEL